MNFSTPAAFNESMGNNTKGNGFFDTLYLAVCSLTWVLGILGICLNSLFVYIMWKVKTIRTTTSYYLLSMAIADITFLILRLVNQEHPDTSSICSVWVLQHIVISVSLFTLTVVSIERYLMLHKPSLSNQNRKVYITPILIATIWMTSILLSLAQYELCSPDHPSLEKALIVFYSSPYFLSIPITVVSYTLCVLKLSRVHGNQLGDDTTRMHVRQVIRMLILTEAAFFICTLPHLFFTFYTFFGPSLSIKKYLTLEYVTNLLLMVNSAINPIIYQFTKKNRHALFIVLPNCIQLFILERQITSNKKKDSKKMTAV